MDILICEDDVQYLNHIKNLVLKHIQQCGYDMNIVIATHDYKAVLDYAKKSSGSSIYYLDIKLEGDISGLDIASAIREKNRQSYIVFITDYDEMMPTTYEYHIEPLDFISKSNQILSDNKICGVLDFIDKQQKNTLLKSLKISVRQQELVIPFDNIIYIESIKGAHKLILYYDDGIVSFNCTLKKIYQILDDRFIRCHKSIIINRDKITHIDRLNHIITLQRDFKCIYSVRSKGMKNVCI